MYEVYIDRWLLPLLPKEIEINAGNKNNTITLINGTEFNILKSPELKKIKLEFVLPAYQYPFANHRLGFKKPKEYLSKFERLKLKKTPFQFIVTREYPTQKKYYDTNIKVSLEEFSVKDTTDEFMDIVVSMELKEYKDPRMTVLEKLEDDLGGYITMPRGITKIFDQIYMSKTGEFLWQIVRAQTGGLEKLGEIMNTNGINNLNEYLPEVIRIANK